VKITKSQLKKIIKEELSIQEQERSLKNQLAVMVSQAKGALGAGNAEKAGASLNQLEEFVDQLPDNLGAEPTGAGPSLASLATKGLAR